MKEIRCAKCGKVIAKTNDIAKINQYAVGGYATLGEDKNIIQIRCPHRIKNKDGTQKDCKEINNIEI